MCIKDTYIYSQISRCAYMHQGVCYKLHGLHP